MKIRTYSCIQLKSRWQMIGGENESAEQRTIVRYHFGKRFFDWDLDTEEIITTKCSHCKALLTVTTNKERS